MKHFIFLVILTLSCIFSVGCSTTRKAAQSTTEQHITSSSQEDRHTELQNGESVNMKQTVNDNTNAVIEFTRVEFNDGTAVIDTTRHENGNVAVKNRDREQTEPPNNGIKSITSGRITLNNDRKEAAETDINRQSETKIDESVSDESVEDNAVKSKTEEKDKRGFIYYLGIIIGAVITAFAIYCIVYGINRIRKQLKNRLPK